MEILITLNRWHRHPVLSIKGYRKRSQQGGHDMIIAEWIDYMNAYRVYDPDNPAWTWAYADSVNEVKAIAERCGEECEIKEV